MSLISVFLNFIIISEFRLNSFAFLYLAGLNQLIFISGDILVRLFVALVPQQPLHQKIRTESSRRRARRRNFVWLLRLAKQREQWRAGDLSALMLLVNIFRASFPTWKVLEWIQTRVHFKVIAAATPAHVSSCRTRLIQREWGGCEMRRWQCDV